MNYKPTIIVWIIALLGIGAAVWMDASSSSEDAALTGPGSLVADGELPVEKINRIELAPQGETTQVFQRRGEKWMQIEPFAFPMNPYSMRQLILAAAQLEVSRSISAGEIDEKSASNGFSLTPPQATITYTWPGDSLTVQLGRESVAGRAYLQTGTSEDVLVVDRTLHDRALGMNPKEWRQRRLFDNVSVDADRVEVSAGEAKIVLERERKTWRMFEPAQTRTDSAAIESYFQALGTAESSGFLIDQPEDLSLYGLAEPAGTLTVTTTTREVVDEHVRREQSQQRLLVGSSTGIGTPQRYAMVQGRPSVIALDAKPLAALFPSAASLVDPTASGVAAADVKSILISGQSGEFRLSRKGETWITPERNNREVATQRVEELLNQLTEVRASRIEIKPFPTDLQVGHITLFGFDARPIDTIRIAYDSQQGRWALENGDGVLRITEESFGPMLKPQDYGLSSRNALITEGAEQSQEN